MDPIASLFLRTILPEELILIIEDCLIADYRHEAASKCRDAIKKELRIIPIDTGTYKIFGYVALRYTEDIIYGLTSIKYRDCLQLRRTNAQKYDTEAWHSAPDRRYKITKDLYTHKWNPGRAYFDHNLMITCYRDKKLVEEMMRRAYVIRGMQLFLDSHLEQTLDIIHQS